MDELVEGVCFANDLGDVYQFDNGYRILLLYLLDLGILLKGLIISNFFSLAWPAPSAMKRGRRERKKSLETQDWFLGLNFILQWNVIIKLLCIRLVHVT